MPRRPRKPQAATVPGLTRRGERAQYERVLPTIGRVSKALGCDYSDPRAIERANALNTLAERGDERVIGRWRDTGEPPITEIVRAVRDGDWKALKRLNVAGPTIREAVDAFLEQAENALNPRSARQYRATLNQLLAHFDGGKVPLASITSKEASEFLYAPKATAGDQPWSPATQGDARTVCASVWDLVIEREREAAEKADATPNVTTNPWRGKGVKLRKRTKTRHAYLLPEEWRALVGHERVRGTPTATLLALACLAGLRRGEICHLRTPYDVDMDAGLIRIQPQPGQWEWFPKGYTDGQTNSVREVPIVPALAEILTEHARRGYAGARYFVRASHADRPLGETTANAWSEVALRAAGLTYGRDEEDSFTLHSLRHTWFTWLVSAGVPIPTIAKFGGNTPTVVLETYAHHMPDDEAVAIQAIQERAG